MKSKQKIIFIVILWILVLIQMVVIFMFSSRNADSSTNESNGFTAFILKIFYPPYKNMDIEQKEHMLESLRFIVRKTAHFTIYAILGMLTYLASYVTLNMKRFKCLILSLPICFLYACSDEIHQIFVPGRSGQFRDVCIDFSGALIATIVVLGIVCIVYKIRSKNKQ